MNEKRVFSDERVLKKLKELNVALVIADMTDNDTSKAIKRDLERIKLSGGGTQSNIPVNLIYPADYGPNSPAILLDELINADDVLDALKRVTGEVAVAGS